MISTSGPRIMIVIGKPHRPAPPIQPICSLVRINTSLRGPITAPTIANATKVAMRAKQLPRNNRFGLIPEVKDSTIFTSPF
jgi:hypothetical protein